MERHEYFEELLAAASMGEAQGAELVELEKHLQGCPDCRQSYADFLQIGSVRIVAEVDEQRQVTALEAIGYIDSTRFREKFLKKAEAEGILSSQTRVSPALPKPILGPIRRRDPKVLALCVAATILLGFGAVVVSHRRLHSYVPATQTSQNVAASSAGQATSANDNREEVSHLEAENRRLTSEISALKASLAKQPSTTALWKASADHAEKERVALLSVAKERDVKIDSLESEVARAETDAADLRTELESVRASDQARIAEDQTRIRELSDQAAEQSSSLDREREMLVANRDIRELMAARNLHIADVFDTDTKGKTRTAFGRVFFTEGKSLIIYAYDLNDRRVQEAGYHYRVWGKKEGPGQGARSLGIFYSDDKAQRRWFFKCEDPKVLSEIDSVFVTLEPPGRNPTEPKGEKFLYAYLRNQPNHP